jgi:hypothetical protein
MNGTWLVASLPTRVELTRIDPDWTQSRQGDERNLVGSFATDRVELTRIELVTSCMPCKRSPN